MKIRLLAFLLFLPLVAIKSQNVDTTYITDGKVTGNKTAFDSYYTIKADGDNPKLFHFCQYNHANSLCRLCTINSKKGINAKDNLLQLFERGKIQKIGKDVLFNETGVAKQESYYEENGRIAYDRSYLENGDTVYLYTDKMPSYQGGFEALSLFFYNCPHPKEVSGLSGTVIVRYIVDESGLIRDATVIKPVHPLLDKEALRVVNLISGMIPGSLKGKPVKTFMTSPLSFGR